MRIVIVGLGSMGRRRARLLQEIGGQDLVGVDLSEERQLQAQQELGIPTYGSLEAAVAAVDPEAAVISTGPCSHASIVSDCLDNGLHVFTELNLIDDGYVQNIAKAKDKGLIWFPSSTFVYRREIEAIQEIVAEKGALGAWTYHVGQYLPDWHPWEDYKNFFVADERTSGIRELLAIELPWLVKTFGSIEEAYHVAQKISKLEVSYNDAIAIAIKHESGAIGMLLIDVVCRTAVRDFTFTNEECFITWDGSPTGLKQLDLTSHDLIDVDVYGDKSADQIDGYARFIVEDAYRAELEAFLGTIQGNSSMRWSLNEDGEIISLIDQLEKR